MNNDSKQVPSQTQLRLPLARTDDFDREQLVVSACNGDAVAAVDAWPDWPGGCLVLVGPEGVGKTHLALSWAAKSQAFIAGAGPIDLHACGAAPVLLEDADRRATDMELFHLINRTDEGASLLMTARTAPRLWPSTLPDLRSRLNALFAVEISPPDDLVLEGVLVKFFRDRNMKVDQSVLDYLTRRIERSVPAALAVVDRLDTAADAAGGNVTRALAREVLGADDLFD